MVSFCTPPLRVFAYTSVCMVTSSLEATLFQTLREGQNAESSPSYTLQGEVKRQKSRVLYTPYTSPLLR